jgi:hypothetical protein
MLESTRLREVTAHHEAGHAVALLIRGGGRLDYIDIYETADYRGYTHWNGKVFDIAFITYAGPWAEARAQWPLADLDGLDDDGCTFDDHVTAAFLANIDGDFEAYETCLASDPTFLASFQSSREECWNNELERVWPVVREVARLLLADGADMYYSPDHRTWHDTIEQLLEAHAEE